MWLWEPHVNSGFMEHRASWGGCWGMGNGLEEGETLLGGGESGVGISSCRHKKEPRLRERRSPAQAQLPAPSREAHQLSGRPPPDARVRPGLPSPGDGGSFAQFLAHAGMGQGTPKPSKPFSTLRCT